MRPCCGVERMDGQDVVDPAPGWVHDPAGQPADFAVSVVVRNYGDARHASASHTRRDTEPPATNERGLWDSCLPVVVASIARSGKQ